MSSDWNLETENSSENFSKRRKKYWEVDSKLYDRIVQFEKIDKRSFNEFIKRSLQSHFPYMRSLKYHLSKIPYSLRLFIIDFISVINSRFMIQRNTKDKKVDIYSYSEKRFIDLKDYIRLMYGYFKEDFTRNIYLVFGYLVFRMNNLLELVNVPQRQLRQLYLLEGKLLDFETINNNLSSLCLCKIVVEPDVMLKILKRLKYLRKFAVKEITGINKVAIMNELKKVKVIRIMECELRSKHCNILCGSANIKVLNLCENEFITSCGLRNIAKNSVCTLVCLDETSIDDSCIEYIEENDKLHELEINGTHITIYGILRLIKHPTVRSIECGNMRYQEFRANEVKSILKGKFDFSSGNNKYIFRKIRKSIRKEDYKECGSLEKLHLDLASIPRCFLEFIRKFCYSLSYISLCNCGLEDDDVGILCRSKSLKGICVSYNSKLTSLSVTLLCTKPELRRVEFCQDHLSDSDAKNFFESTNIDHLWIEGKELTNKCLLSLQNNLNIRVLAITGESGINKFGIKFVKTSCFGIKELRYGETSEIDKYWFRE